MTFPAGFSKVHPVDARSTCGDVAQLGEHCLRKAGVESSNLFISTTQEHEAPPLKNGGAFSVCFFFAVKRSKRSSSPGKSPQAVLPPLYVLRPYACDMPRACPAAPRSRTNRKHCTVCPFFLLPVRYPARHPPIFLANTLATTVSLAYFVPRRTLFAAPFRLSPLSSPHKT